MDSTSYIVYVVEPNPHYEGTDRQEDPPKPGQIAIGGIPLGCMIWVAAELLGRLGASYMVFNQRIFHLVNQDDGYRAIDTGYLMRALG